MSEFDEMDFDDEELEDLRDPDDVSPEDVFNMVMINKIRRTKVRVELQYPDGDVVELPDVIEELLGYIKDKLKDEDVNPFTEQIMPLMSQAVVSGLGRMIGIRGTAFILSNDMTRMGMIHMMGLSLLLLKFVQDKGLLIHTYEEEVTDEEIEELERRSKANSLATMGQFMGMDPKDILQEMRQRGQITNDDLQAMLGDDAPDDDINLDAEDDDDDSEDEDDGVSS